MFASSTLDELNPEQRSAATHSGAPLLIVAGAGTGKTKTLAARVIRLIDEGSDPNRILLLTFTRRSASEMIGRVTAASTNRSASKVWGGTFHSTANRLLRHFGTSAGLPQGFTVLDQADSTDLMGMARTEEGFGERSKRFPRKETVAGIYSRMVNGQAKLADVLDKDYPWCAEHQDDLKTIFTRYTLQKREHQVLDYDDLLLFWRGLTASSVGDSMRDLFDHILIDEYQDTNPIQSDIIRGMCRGQDEPRPTDLCAVGDDAQAIYGFRSATVANMWAFGEHFPGANIVTLEQNYRSTMPILQIANEVINQPISITVKSRGTSTPQQPEPAMPAAFKKELWSTKTTGPQPVLAIHHDEGAQSRSVADAVLAARERGIDLREQAVLFRAGHHSDGLELELTRRDIPFVKYGGLKYLESAHVKDLLAILRVLDNPADQLAWHRLLPMLDGVGPATVRRLVEQFAIEDKATDSLKLFLEGAGTFPPAARPQSEELRAALQACQSSDDASDSLTTAEQVDRLKPFCRMVFANRYNNAAARLADIDQLAATASGYNSRSRFLTELTLDPPSKTSEQASAPHLDDDWLTLSTVHSAKGGEWKAVHLLHVSDGNMPSDMAVGDKDGLAEELRLLYVALTRAKDELTVNVPLRYHVNRFGSDDRHLYGQISRFIEPVRHHFHETSGDEQADEDAIVDLHAVGVADEVDAMLHSLWD